MSIGGDANNQSKLLDGESTSSVESMATLKIGDVAEYANTSGGGGDPKELKVDDVSDLLSKLRSSLSLHFENLEKIRFYSSDPAHYYAGFVEGIEMFYSLLDLWKNNPLGVGSIAGGGLGNSKVSLNEVISGSTSAVNYLLSLTAHFVSICAVSVNRPAATIELCR